MSSIGHNQFALRADKVVAARGTYTGLRGDHSGALVVQQAGRGTYGEAVLKGNVYSGSAEGMTLAAGNLVGAAAGANTNTCLFNPSGSGVYAVLLRVSISFDSGTFAAGGFYHGRLPAHSVATSLAAAVAPTNMLFGSGNAAACRFTDSDSGAALTGGTAPVPVYPMFGTTATVIANASPKIGEIVQEIDGAIVIPPGEGYIPLGAGAGTSVVFNFGYVWEEIPASTI